MCANTVNVAVRAMLCFNFIAFCYSDREQVVAQALKRDRFNGVSFSNFERHEKHRLMAVSEGRSVSTKEDSSIDCGFTCTRLPWCFSYNFQRSADKDGKYLCEVLATDKYNKSEDYKESDDFDHFGILSPCSQRPCQNGGTCVALYDKNDLSCVCAADYTGKHCEAVNLRSTCKEVYDAGGAKEDKAYLLKMDTGKVSIFCHMNDIPTCGGGGWTLVMKIDGSKATFSYTSSYWRDNATYNLPGGATGLDNQETKLPSYWNTPFTKLCLGMKVSADTRFILLHKQASSLYSLIADGKFRATSLGREAWKSLITGSSLQTKCGEEGFNVNNRVKIGIIGNQEADCNTPDSFLGFGSSYASYYCGNFARVMADNGDKSIIATGYIFVQ